MPLAAVSGACLSTEVALGAASLPFGTVVVGSQVILSFILRVRYRVMSTFILGYMFGEGTAHLVI